MKKLFSLAALASLFLPALFASAALPLTDTIIALDAGHGGTELGAQYPANCANDGDTSDCQIYEKDVNLEVVYALQTLLQEQGAQVVLTREGDETIARRKDRVDIAIEKCEQVAGRKCDALISLHHNGSMDPAYDGTTVIYNEKQDIPLAESLLESLVPLTGINEGLDHGGYGMTVYGHMVSAITEAYYITNDEEAALYLAGDGDGDGVNDRVQEEAQYLRDGIVNYFTASGGGGNGGGGNDCPPGQARKGTCS